MPNPLGRSSLVILGFCAAAVLSVSFKVYAWDPTPGVSPDIQVEVREVLDGEGFTIGSYVADPPSIYADRGNCHLTVSQPSYDGYHKDVIREVAGSNETVYLFEGETFSEQPTLRTRLAYFWHKALNAVGIPSSRGTLLAVISSPGCERLPLAALGAIGR